MVTLLIVMFVTRFFFLKRNGKKHIKKITQEELTEMIEEIKTGRYIQSELIKTLDTHYFEKGQLIWILYSLEKAYLHEVHEKVFEVLLLRKKLSRSELEEIKIEFSPNMYAPHYQRLLTLLDKNCECALNTS